MPHPDQERDRDSISDSDWISERERREQRVPKAKGLQFAMIMLAACIAVTLLIGVLFRQLPSEPRVAPAQLANAVPARGAAKPVANMVRYQADPSGHFYVDAAVNGTSIRFLVDTGATFVALTRDDARAVGISDNDLDFSLTTSTANGQGHAAWTTLGTVRLEQMEVLEVRAMVMEQPMAVSLLGMSFLNKLQGYSIRDGVLTMEW
jgi:aspartyl protease family protein